MSQQFVESVCNSFLQGFISLWHCCGGSSCCKIALVHWGLWAFVYSQHSSHHRISISWLWLSWCDTLILFTSPRVQGHDQLNNCKIHRNCVWQLLVLMVRLIFAKCDDSQTSPLWFWLCKVLSRSPEVCSNATLPITPHLIPMEAVRVWLVLHKTMQSYV